MEGADEILVVKEDNIYISEESDQVTILEQEQELIEYVYTNCKKQDLFNIYIHQRYFDRLNQNVIFDLPYVKRITFFFDDLDQLKQFKLQHKDVPSKVDFCLASEVANRIRNILNRNLIQSPENLNLDLKQQLSWTNHMGFNAANLKNIDSKYICKSCELILRNPVQLLECGHRICQCCAESLNGVICPYDGCNQYTSANDIIRDKAFEREMQTLEVKCNYCQWEGRLRIYKDHLHLSHYMRTPCSLNNYECSTTVNLEKCSNDSAVETKNEDVHRLQLVSNSLNDLIPSIENDISLIKQKETERMNQKPSLEDVNQESLEHLQTNVVNTVLSEGNLVWKITDFREKINDTIVKHQLSIYSPPFYSSITGYKMRLRLYLNGYGNARDTHMSLFFQLMKGEYDPILQWPFNYKIAVCLYNQSDAQKHIIQPFQPNPYLASFQQPITEMNVAWGIPKFCPLSCLQDLNSSYVIENMIFIGMIIHFDPTTNEIARDVFHLNPGIPMPLRIKMIQQAKSS